MHSESLDKIIPALLNAQKEIKSAIKESENPFFKSKYADLSSTWHACKDALHKFDLVISQTLLSTAEGQCLNTTLFHTSGQWIKGSCPLFVKQGSMQELGSAISYARRYSIAAICGVVTEDDDANKADGKEIPKANSFVQNNGLYGNAGELAQSDNSLPDAAELFHQPEQRDPSLISEKQEKMFYARCKQLNMGNQSIRDFLSSSLGVFHSAHIPKKDFNKMLEELDKKKKSMDEVPF